MGRKVFMSVLGTGFYEECTYAGSRKKTMTRFIQTATLNDIGADTWTENDAVYVFLTDMARMSNWMPPKEGRKRRDGVIVPYSGLENELVGMGLKCRIFPMDIKDGKDEKEMWEVFHTIYSCIKDGDELYFDLTHAFRYLPMLVLVLGNYAKFMNGTRIAYISYGNYEARNKECNKAPIVNLLPLAMLQDWTSAAAAFSEMGRVKGLVGALEDELAAKTFVAADKNSFNTLAVNLKSFEGQMLTCRGKDIVAGNSVMAVKNLKRKVSADKVLPYPLKQILLSVIGSVGGFRQKSTENIVEALNWCKKYSLVQQGYTLCQEGLVTCLCERYDMLNTCYAEDKKGRLKKDLKAYRDFWSSVLAVKDEIRYDESLWQSGLLKHKDLARKIYSQKWIDEIREKYSSLTDCRNTVNHGGFVTAEKEDKLIGEFNKVMDNCIPLFGKIMNDLPDLPECHENTDVLKIFINYSNHPSEKWCDSQKAEAGKYGEIIDLKFPVIEPDLSEDGIDKLAEAELEKILGFASGKDAAVHIMGEQTLSFVLINKLKAHGIRCVASTTERMVKELDDNTRVVEFSFVRFREY